MALGRQRLIAYSINCKKTRGEWRSTLVRSLIDPTVKATPNWNSLEFSQQTWLGVHALPDGDRQAILQPFAETVRFHYAA
jgi:hypothetical protein